MVERYLAKVVVAGSTPVSRFYFQGGEPQLITFLNLATEKGIPSILERRQDNEINGFSIKKIYRRGDQVY